VERASLSFYVGVFKFSPPVVGSKMRFSRAGAEQRLTYGLSFSLSGERAKPPSRKLPFLEASYLISVLFFFSS